VNVQTPVPTAQTVKTQTPPAVSVVETPKSVVFPEPAAPELPLLQIDIEKSAGIFNLPSGAMSSTPEPSLVLPGLKPQPEEQRKSNYAVQMDSLLRFNCGNWSAVLKKVDGDIIYSYNSKKNIHPASVIKIPIGILFLKWAEQQKVANLTDFLQNKGTNGRTFYQLLRAMVVFTEEQATQILTDFLANNLDTEMVLKNWGLTQTSLRPRATTAEEMASIFENLYTGKYLTPLSTQLLLSLMEEYTPNDDTRLGSIRRLLPTGSRIYNKRGSLAQGTVIVADAAILVIPEKQKTDVFVLEIFGSTSIDSKTCTYEQLDETIKKSGHIFFEYLHPGNAKKKNEIQ
jgi:hypothetical protein